MIPTPKEINRVENLSFNLFKTKKKFSFQMASFEKIVRKSLFAFMPVYTSFIMQIIPLIEH